MDFDPSINQREGIIGNLEAQVNRGQARLTPPRALGQRMEKSGERMESFYPDALEKYPQPSKESGFWRKLLQRITGRQKRDDAESTASPKRMALQPLEPELRRLWRERDQRMVTEELPALSRAKLNAEAVTKEFTSRLPPLQESYESSRRLEIPTDAPQDLRPLRLSLARRLFNWWRKTPPTLIPVQVKTLDQVLHVPLCDLDSTRRTWDQEHQDWIRSMEALSEELNAILRSALPPGEVNS